MSKKPQKIFDIRIKDVKQRDGSTVKKAVAQFAKGVEITLNGEKVDLGEYKSVFLKTRTEVEESLDYAQENFGLKADYVEDQKAFMEEKKISSVCEVTPKK